MYTRTESVTTRVPPAPTPRHVAALPVTLAADQPQYKHVGGGRFLPANEAALRECAAWNAWADRVNARTTRTRIAQ